MRVTLTMVVTICVLTAKFLASASSSPLNRRWEERGWMPSTRARFTMCELWLIMWSVRFCAKEDEYVELRWFFGRAFANCDGVVVAVVAAAIGFGFGFGGFVAVRWAFLCAKQSRKIMRQSCGNFAEAENALFVNFESTVQRCQILQFCSCLKSRFPFFKYYIRGQTMHHIEFNRFDTFYNYPPIV